MRALRSVDINCAKPHNSWTMKRLRPFPGAMAATLALATCSICAASPASDNAADPAYNGGWVNGSNGGSGWGGGWILNGAAARYSITSSTTNGNGDNGNPGGGIAGDGDIDTAGRAWGIAAGIGETNTAIRDFGSPMGVSDVFRIRMDTGFIDNGGRDEFRLTSATNGIFLQLFFVGGASTYTLVDGAGTHDTGIPFTDEGLDITLRITGMTGNGAYLYNITVNILGGSGFTFANVMNVPAPNDQITRIALINQNAGPGADHILYFNGASVPEPSTLVLVSLAAIAALAASRRRALI